MKYIYGTTDHNQSLSLEYGQNLLRQLYKSIEKS